MANWRFGAFPKLPYSTMQQLNLDWILDRIRRFLPDTGTKGQVLTRTKDGAAWVDPEATSGAVSSVNGKTGAVVLTASDVGALPSSYQAPVTSVNGMTGDVIVSGGGAVDSVNGQTGDVVLTAADVGALPSSTVIPDSTSDLTNDSGFITAAQAAAAAPVQSVNGQTGDVVLGAADVGAAEPNESGAGYCKMPDGLMLQWGVQNVRTASAGGAYGYYGNSPFTFQIPFVGAAPSCFANVGEYAAFWSGSIHSITLTGATASIGGNQNGTTKPVYWFAVGRWK